MRLHTEKTKRRTDIDARTIKRIDIVSIAFQHLQNQKNKLTKNKYTETVSGDEITAVGVSVSPSHH